MIHEAMSSISAFCKDVKVNINLEFVHNVLKNSWYKITYFEERFLPFLPWDGFSVNFKIEWPDVWLLSYTFLVSKSKLSIEELSKEDTLSDIFWVWWIENDSKTDTWVVEINLITNTEWDAIDNVDWNIVNDNKWNPIIFYHKQLKVISLFTDYAELVRDNNSYSFKDINWIREVGWNDTYSSPDILFIINSSFKEIDWEKYYWLQTRWLQRCWRYELEMINVKEKHLISLWNLLKSIAVAFIDKWFPPYMSYITDLWGISFGIAPYEYILQYMPDVKIWTMEDRENMPKILSCVLYIEEKKFFRSKTVLKPLDKYWEYFLKEPISFFSKEESDRMSKIALEKVSCFIDSFNKYKWDKDWEFKVKISVETENKKYTNYEYLRFELKDFSWDEVTWVLLNKPYFIKRIKKWDTYIGSIKDISWWTIKSDKFGFYNPDTIYLLKKII